MSDNTTSITRKLGNSVAITLPKRLNVAVGQEYIIIKKQSGAITSIPKVADYFANAEPDEFYTPELNVGYTPYGSEVGE